MGRLRTSLGLSVALAVACAGPSVTKPPARVPPTPAASTSNSARLRFDVGAIDPHADPCVDFYRYACGGWRATHPIPSDQVRWSRYAELIALNHERERAIIEAATHADPTATAAERRVGTYYAACMDEAGIAARGLSPIRAHLSSIAQIQTARAAADAIADFQLHGLDAAFSVFVRTDPHDPTKRTLRFDKGSLALRDPAIYTKNDDASTKLRARYRDHLTRIFALLGDDEAAAAEAATRVIAFETALAARALSAVERRNAEKTDHPMAIPDLAKRYRSIDWPAYFARLGLSAIDQVNVAQPAWLDAVDAAVGAKDLEGLRQYLRLLLVRTSAMALPSGIEAEVFDLRERTLRGAKEMPPRWKRCVGLVDRDLGDDVGRIFLARHFHDDARARVGKMIDAISRAYRADIASSDWLGDSAREAALAKLDKGLIVIGSSRRLRSFDDLRIEPGDPFGNGWRAQAFGTARELAALTKPVDREEFFEALPQELDAFGSKTMNATGFTAGFLQPPIFDPEVDDAVNFGGVGSVMGHELSHQFDDEGRKYDADGARRSWWSAEDVARFEERARCFVDEYARFRIDDGTPVDGKLTLGENIADNGGIRLSYAALRPSELGPKIDGYTPAQRFFLAWGQIRCENVTIEAARRQVESDEHAPGSARVNGVVSNVPEFARAFACAPGSPMAPTTRCAIW